MKENIADVLKVLADKRMEMSLIRTRERDPEYKTADGARNRTGKSV